LVYLYEHAPSSIDKFAIKTPSRKGGR
jgi:hypothetical protein